MADWISDWLDNRLQGVSINEVGPIIWLEAGHEWSPTGIRAGSIAVSHLHK